MRRVLRMSGATLTASLLALACLLQMLCIWRAGPAFSPSVISVTLAPGQSLTLGRHALAAPQADAEHLSLRRDLAGRWWAGNASAGHVLLLQRERGEQRIGSVAPAAGQQLRIGAARFDVLAADQDAIAFAGGGHAWRYDGAALLRDGMAQGACADSGVGARLAALWNRAAPLSVAFRRPLVFGGNLNCGNRIGIAHATPGSAILTRVDRQLMLAAGGDAPVQLSSAAGVSNLASTEEALSGASALVAGHTRLALTIDGDRLLLRPGTHTALFADTRIALPPGVQWQWRQRANWALPGGAAAITGAALCILLGIATIAGWQRETLALRCAAIGSALLAIGGLTALLAQRAGTPPGVGVSMLLGCAALWCCLLRPARLTLVSAAGILLLALGLLAQLELGFGAMESSWLRHYQKSTALLAIGLGVASYAQLRWRGAGAALKQNSLEWMLALLAGGALAALLLQVVFGDETGVFDLQPVEFAKLALTALTAHCIAIGMGWHRALPEHERTLLRVARLAAPALLFIGLLGLALVQVDDYSPLVLLLVWSMVMGFAFALAARRLVLALVLAATGVAALTAIAALRGAGAAEVAQWGFYADRFLVWLDPAGHPHTGQQLLSGARAIAEGAWWGADSMLGLSSLGQPAAAALRIPAVQDDFAPSFFINRHGLLGALALWALQALFLVGLLQTAARSFAASVAARDFRQAWLGRFRCFALCGGAAFVLGHFLLSWGSNLSIFPIMGQPMSFLSAGGSHLLFFICPLLAFSAMCAQSFEESQSCRSMSNTKC